MPETATRKIKTASSRTRLRAHGHFSFLGIVIDPLVGNRSLNLGNGFFAFRTRSLLSKHSTCRVGTSGFCGSHWLLSLMAQKVLDGSTVFQRQALRIRWKEAKISRRKQRTISVRKFLSPKRFVFFLSRDTQRTNPDFRVSDDGSSEVCRRTRRAPAVCSWIRSHL